MHANCLLVISN